VRRGWGDGGGGDGGGGGVGEGGGGEGGGQVNVMAHKGTGPMGRTTTRMASKTTQGTCEMSISPGGCEGGEGGGEGG